MTRLWRYLAALFLSLFMLVAPLSGTAQAASPQTTRAAAWLASQVKDGTLDAGWGDPIGNTIDGLLALAASDDQALQPTVDAMLATVKSGAASYATTPARAAKLAVVEDAFATDFGLDLTGTMKAGVAAHGGITATPTPYTQGLVMAGLDRAGATVPTSTAAWLATQQNADGGFGYAAGQPSDADSTGMAILGLTTVDSDAAKASLAKAIAWAKKTQAGNGSWGTDSLVNSTAVMASGLVAADQNVDKAVAYLGSVQLANGALPYGSTADLMATSQGVLALAGESLLDVAWQPQASTPATPRPSATAPSASPTPDRGLPAPTGDEADLTPLGVAAAVLTLAGAAWVGRR